MNPWAHLPEADDVSACTEALASALKQRRPSPEDMQRRAGGLRWTCSTTLAHICDAVLWYAANLAARSPSDYETPLLSPRKPAAYMVSCLRSSGALLATAVQDAPPDARGYHPWGRADTSGFAAMGCDEILIHGWDLGQGLGFEFTPPPGTAERTVRRLFPWAPHSDEADPWQALLWANGRIELPGRPSEKRWLWHNEPLDEWNGEPRRWKPKKS